MMGDAGISRQGALFTCVNGYPSGPAELTVRVTREDIAGFRSYGTHPVTVAVKRITGGKVATGGEMVDIWLPVGAGSRELAHDELTYEMTRDTAALIDAIDRATPSQRAKMAPFTFTMTLADR
jgi:hypothetical protein